VFCVLKSVLCFKLFINLFLLKKKKKNTKKKKKKKHGLMFYTNEGAGKAKNATTNVDTHFDKSRHYQSDMKRLKFLQREINVGSHALKLLRIMVITDPDNHLPLFFKHESIKILLDLEISVLNHISFAQLKK
jgi:hypothetical protein